MFLPFPNTVEVAVPLSVMQFRQKQDNEPLTCSKTDREAQLLKNKMGTRATNQQR